ncbi:MAG TPA: hypothetical protein VG295_06565 [Solirubrobacteraceae bacterium]|nr:hypothetical protein [Solirubrobacteraceae bacterium]
MLAGLLAVTACGTSATERFKARYAAAQAPLNRTFADIANTFTHAKGKTTAEIAGSLTALADRFHRQLAPLEALKPPAPVATAFRTLTGGLDRMERDLRATSSAVKGRDLVAAHDALASLQRDAGAATRAASAVTHTLNHK